MLKTTPFYVCKLITTGQSSRCADGRPLTMQWSQGEALFRALDPKQETVSAWNDPAQNLIQYVRNFMENGA